MQEFDVADMSCNHCVSTITKALSALSSGVSVQADLETRRIRVSGDVDQNAVVAALDDVGFEAKPVQG